MESQIDVFAGAENQIDERDLFVADGEELFLDLLPAIDKRACTGRAVWVDIGDSSRPQIGQQGKRQSSLCGGAVHSLAHPLASDNVQCIQVVEHVIQHMDIQSVKNHANLKLPLTPTSVVVTSHH